MKDIVNEYMKNNRATDWFGVKRLHCKDGFSMSVQAHYGAYCAPRVDHTDTDYYFEVEVGFPSEREELLMEYVVDCDKPTDTIYAYVPAGVVQEVIEKHGGIKV